VYIIIRERVIYYNDIVMSIIVDHGGGGGNRGCCGIITCYIPAEYKRIHMIIIWSICIETRNFMIIRLLYPPAVLEVYIVYDTIRSRTTRIRRAVDERISYSVSYVIQIHRSRIYTY